MTRTLPRTRKWQEGDKEEYIRRAKPLIDWLERNLGDLKRLDMATSLLGYYLKRSTINRAERAHEDAKVVLFDLHEVMREFGENPYAFPKTSTAKSEMTGQKSKRR